MTDPSPKTNGPHNASNLAGLSTHSSTALSFYLNQRKSHAVILTETHRELAAQETNNYSAISYCGTTGRGGVSILVRKDKTHVPKIFNAPIDPVWTIVTINRIPMLLGAVYIPPTSSPKLQPFISQLEEAAAFSTRHNLEFLLAGESNARHPMWGDRSTNEHGRTLVNALHDASRVLNVINDGQPTFVSTNGSSVIDLFIMSEKINETTNFIIVDHEAELFTGAPTKGHLPVWMNKKGEDTKEVKFKKDLKNANWKGFYECVESLLTERIDFKTMDGNSSWLLLEEALQTASEKHIPVKKVCCFSKPYWCKELSSKCRELRKARKKYRYRCSTQNLKLLRELQQSFQNLVKDKANEYFKSSIEDDNDSQSKEFWKPVNKL